MLGEDIRNEWIVGTNDVESLLAYGAGRIQAEELHAQLLEEGWPEADAHQLVAIADEARTTRVG